MQTLDVGAGYSAEWIVTLRDADGREILDTYDGTEALDLVVVGDDGSAVDLIASEALWLDATAGTVTLRLDQADTASLSAAPRALSIGLTIADKRFEAFRARLRVQPRATS